MRHVNRTKHGVANESIRAGIALAVVVVVLLPATASALDPPAPLSVLFVANGYYIQETHIEDHFLDLGYAVTRRKDYQIKGTTSLVPYDLIVLTEFAPSVSTSGINNIKNSGKPVLIVEYWDFNYSKKLGLTTSASCGYVGTDTVEAVREGYDAFTSLVGVEALVYQPSYTVYGIDASKLTAGTTPLYWSSASFGEVAVLVHRGKKVAATGVYDTRKYTVDAWKMFDLLIEQVVPPRPRWQTMQDVAQAYVDSGLYSFLVQVESDLARDPGSWTFDDVEREAWLRTWEWNLREIWDYLQGEASRIFDVELFVPVWEFSYDHPERPHGSGAGFLPSQPPFDDEHEHWFLGQHWDAANQVAPPPKWRDYHDGTDLGLGPSTGLNGRRIFYLGDTWDYGFAEDPPDPQPRWSPGDCEVGSGVRCDDMIAVSNDPHPDDGIDVSPAFEPFESNGTYEARWIPLVIPGVHKDISPVLHSPPATEYWYDIYHEPAYSAPTGAVTTYTEFVVTLGGNQVAVRLPFVMLWYGTGINPSAMAGLDSDDPRRRPASWAGTSLDGMRFYAAYRDQTGQAVPFSDDVAPTDCPEEPGFPCADPGDPARFVMVAAMDVSSDEHVGLCSDHPSSPMCDPAVYDMPVFPYTHGGGLLLLGSGRPYRKSGLFLAFIEREDIGKIGPGGRPLVHYRTSGGWSWDEADAVSITHPSGEPPCDSYREPNYPPSLDPLTWTFSGCWPNLAPIWASESVFGETSARLIASADTEVESGIVLLNGNPWSPWVLYWKAPLYEPWGGDFGAGTPAETKTSGYGPYIIDSYSDDSYPGSGSAGEIVLWHTISVWNGLLSPDPDRTPYGVYTGKEVIPW
jgi:hypothetical protein